MAGIALAASGVPAAWAESEDLRRFGDVYQFAAPLAALGSTFAYDDAEGRAQFANSFLTMQIFVQGGKQAFSKLRPTGTSRTSFPSGHTAASFSGAAFLNTRYGPYWGVPAYALAALTGYSRVNADAHFVDDVLAGASIAVLTNQLFATPMEGAAMIVPFQTEDAVGLRTVIPLGTDAEQEEEAIAFDPNFRFSFALGPVWQSGNSVTAPENGGTRIDFTSFEENDDPTTSADISLQWFISDRQQLRAFFNPFELRDFGDLSANTQFGNAFFPAGSRVRSAFRLNVAALDYSYDVAPQPEFEARLGAGLSLQLLEVELGPVDANDQPTGPVEQVDEETLTPYLTGRFGYNVTEDWQLWTEANSTFLVSDDELVDLGVGVTYAVDERWDLGLSYRYYDRKLETGTIKSEFEFDAAQLTIGYRF